MRALRFHGPGDLRIEEVPDPRPAPGEVVVTVAAAGVCGSDLHFLDGSARTSHVPITLGHEVAGTLDGKPVAVELGAACGDCRRCAEGRPNLCERASVPGLHRDGGLADAVAVAGESVVPIPVGVNAAAAATAVDAGTTAYHALHRRAAVASDEAVLVIGAGGLGTYGIQFARLMGAEPVIVADTDPGALERATALGADETVLVEPERSVGRIVKMLTDGGVDVAIEFVGLAATVDAAIKSLRPGGRAVAVGVGIEPITTLPPVLWSNNEYTLTGSYGGLPGDAGRVMDLLASGDLKPPPVATLTLDEAAPVIVDVAAGRASLPGRPMVIL